MKAKITLIITLFTIISCNEKNSIEQKNIVSFIHPKEISNYDVIIFVPLENSCSSCSQITMARLTELNVNEKSKIILIFTAKSNKLIDQSLKDYNFKDFDLIKDPNYESWKVGLVDNNPLYYLLNDDKIIKRGNITFETVLDEIEIIKNHIALK